jgi:hypothetical protein
MMPLATISESASRNCAIYKLGVLPWSSESALDGEVYGLSARSVFEVLEGLASRKRLD